MSSLRARNDGGKRPEIIISNYEKPQWLTLHRKATISTASPPHTVNN